MKVKELISVIVDKVNIYKTIGENFEDIYKGNTNDIPSNILEMKVRIIGASKKGVLDIQVF
ncbi:hypothetical protein [Clostridium sp. BNL1100]|uniref:hypothetical protein n=1 Tax=Clostridium sp. BNL1100 TaxID=755731 RepID=UPI00024A780E|nr:hypothetical protein [Clostridium sp. BNL1100]AEY66088.1 hypothetical protein Clo1100_1883 [Clostridium sp. BNL1100]